MLDTDLPVPARIAAGIERARRHIAASGATLDGLERVEVAKAARRAWSGDGPVVDATVAQSTAAKIATKAHELVASDVTAFDDPATYVEILGVVARTVAIDTAARGLGASEVALPDGSTDAPTGHFDPAARQRSALVPVVGAAGPTSGLSLVPSESAAQEDLHGALYLTYDEMGDIAIHKGLPRWQLELVAARTSLINHCFF